MNELRVSSLPTSPELTPVLSCPVTLIRKVPGPPLLAHIVRNGSKSPAFRVTFALVGGLGNVLVSRAFARVQPDLATEPVQMNTMLSLFVMVIVYVPLKGAKR